MLLNDNLMTFFWFSWLDLLEVEGLRNCLVSVFSFSGLKKKHLVVVHLLKIWNAMTLTLKPMIFHIFHL